MAHDSLVFGDALTGLSEACCLLIVHHWPGGARVAVIVLTIQVDGVFAHHLSDAVKRPFKTFRIAKVVGNCAVPVRYCPLGLVTVVFHQAVNSGNPFRFKPHQHFHSGGMASLVRFAEGVSWPFDCIEFPGTYSAPPVFGNSVSIGIEIPSGIKPTKIGNHFFVYQTVECASPCVESFRDAAVGVRQSCVAREASGGKRLDELSRSIGSRHVVVDEPVAPQVCGIVGIAAFVWEHHD